MRLKILLCSLVLLALTTSTAFAQTFENLISLFNTSEAVVTTTITKDQQNTTVRIEVPPITGITVPAGTFKDYPEDIIIRIYKGDWDRIRKVLPEGHSPLSSYYISMTDTTGKTADPLSALSVDVFNNHTGTDTYYYPLNEQGTIDQVNQQKYEGQVVVRKNLPAYQPAFVVSVNKELDANDPALQPPPPTASPQPIGINDTNSLKLLIVFLVLVTSIIGFLLYKKFKK